MKHKTKSNPSVRRKAFRYRAYPSEDMIQALRKAGGCIRFGWNKQVELGLKYEKELGKVPSQSEFQRFITAIKKEYEFLKKDVHSQPLQITSKRITEAYARAFSPEMVQQRQIAKALAEKEKDPERRAKKLSRAERLGFPKYKAKRRDHVSLYYPQSFTITRETVKVPKLGTIPYLQHRPLEGTPKSVTVIEDGPTWMITILCEIETPKPVKPALDSIDPSRLVGGDFGLKEFLTMSNGNVIPNPKNLNKFVDKLEHEQRNLSRKELKEEVQPDGTIKKISSKNRDKQLKLLARINWRLRNIRSNFLYIVAYNMITKYDVLCFESLDIQGMMQDNKKKGKHSKNRNIADVSWSELLRILEYKADWNGKYFVKIDQWYASSQTCHRCGHRHAMPVSERVFRCPECKLEMDRDLNASKNILREGLRLLREQLSTKFSTDVSTAATAGSACGGTEIRISPNQEKRIIQFADGTSAILF